MADEVRALTTEQRAVQAENDRGKMARMLLYGACTYILTVVLLVVFMFVLIQRNNRLFCDVLTANTSSAPPTSDRGREVSERVNTLARKLGCPDIATHP